MQSAPCEGRVEFLSLPVVMIENILSFLSFDEIARSRIVCKELDAVCQRMLNRGFLMIERRHALSLKSVKARLPRRESERRLHRLSRHCDILSAIETRISMLNMTYAKFIDHKICCFIPGKVIDEIRRVLDVVERPETPPRAHEVLQELRDISSMAIEHFDDRISPALRRRLQQGAAAAAGCDRLAGRLHVDTHGDHTGQPSVLWSLQRRSAMNGRLALLLTREYTKMGKRMNIFRTMAMKERATVRALMAKVNEQGATIAELKKRMDECDIKYSELTHTNQAAGGKAVGAAAEPGGSGAAGGAQPLRNFASQIKLDLSVLPIGTGKRAHGKGTPNIKPRKPVIRLPSISEEDPDEPKAKQAKLDSDPAGEGTSQDHQPAAATSKGGKGKPKGQSVAKMLKRLEKDLSRNVAGKEKPGGEMVNSILGKRKVVAMLDQSLHYTMKIPKIDYPNLHPAIRRRL